MADPYDRTAGLFGISVAAGMVGTGVQNLRAYEKAGLVDPQRTPGGTRLYSLADIERLRQIAALLDDGLNLAGIAMVLQLEADNARLRREISHERDRRRGR
ncbi:MAG TPA: MerR family transcriptional regulator [Propionibacteriaceae bacterium]|nr:MerR family transcriptional regulator [Propionibacteriaceae bacterium]